MKLYKSKPLVWGFIALLLIVIMYYVSNFYQVKENFYPITIDDAEQILLGKTMYQNNCSSCHKVNLAGVAQWKIRDDTDNLPAPPLNGNGHAWHHHDEMLFKIIKYGTGSFVENYKGDMKAYKDKLSDEEIIAVLAYMKSYWPKDKYERQIMLIHKSNIQMKIVKL